MNETTKTTVFAGSAATMVLAAVISHFVSQPRAAKDFDNVGTEFYETFVSSDQAAALEVVAMDPETADLKRFKVENVDGLWRIPSHENYPAEAAARLATTASSVMGLERESLAGRRASDYERLGVVDPLDEDIEDPDAVGQRIRLLDKDGEALADYIIGKQAEDVVVSGAGAAFGSSDDREKYYYVRRHDESQTYKVPLKIDLSTRFSDWIDPDLLRIEGADLNSILVRNYSLQEQAGGNPLMPRSLAKVPGDTLKLTKDEADAWMLDGLDAESEKLTTARVTEMIDVLEGLKIADVRRKSKFRGKDLLTPDLKLNRDPDFEKTPEQFGQAIVNMQRELVEKGFNLAGSAEQLELVSENGDLELLTNEGVVYTLHVGSPFEEDDQEIKVAAAGDPAAEDDDSKAADDAADDADADAKNRYLMIRVAFDQDRMSDQPVEPTEPVAPKKPKGYVPAPEPKADDAADADESANEADEAADEAGDDETQDEATESDAEKSEQPQRRASFEAYDIAMREYEAEKVDYELALTRLVQDKAAFADRVTAALEQVKELNQRFGDWFYVVSGDNLQALQVTRDDLVTRNESAAAEPEASVVVPKDLPVRPNISFPETVDPEGGEGETGSVVEDSVDASSEAMTDQTTEKTGESATDPPPTSVEPPASTDPTSEGEVETDRTPPETPSAEPSEVETGVEPVVEPDPGNEPPTE